MCRLKVPNTIRVPLQVAACILFTPLFTAVDIVGAVNITDNLQGQPLGIDTN